MSVDVMSSVWKTSTQKANRLLLLLALADNANDDGWAYPSQATLAAKCRLGRRAVQKLLDALEADGEIVIHNRRVQGSAQHYSNVYHLARYGVADSEAPVDLRGELTKRVPRSERPDTTGGVANSGTSGSERPDTTPSERPDTRVANGRSHESLQEPSVIQPSLEPKGSSAPPQTHLPAALSMAIDDAADHAYQPIDNHTGAMLQADVFIRVFEGACKARNAPQTIPRTRNNRRIAAQWYLDGYTDDEIRRAVDMAFEAGRPVAFAFLGEKLAFARNGFRPATVNVRPASGNGAHPPARDAPAVPPIALTSAGAPRLARKDN